MPEPKMLCDICPWPATRKLKQQTPNGILQRFFGVSLRVAYCCDRHIPKAMEYIRTGKQPEWRPRRSRRAR